MPLVIFPFCMSGSIGLVPATEQGRFVPELQRFCDFSYAGARSVSIAALNVSLGRITASPSRGRRSSSRRGPPARPAPRPARRRSSPRRRPGARRAARTRPRARRRRTARQRLRPVQRQVEVAAAVVELVDLALRRLAVLQQLAGRRVQRVARTFARGLSVLSARNSSDTASARNSPSESQRRWFSLTSCCTCLGAEPPAPVSNSPPPCISGTIESIFALVPSSRIGNRSVR